MILIDGKELSFEKEMTETGEVFKDKKAHKIYKSIQAMGLEKKPYEIEYPKKLVYVSKDSENEGRPERKAMYGIPLTETNFNYFGDNLTHTITVCDKILKTGKNKNIDRPVNKDGKTVFNFRGYAILHPKDGELAWFLNNISSRKDIAFVEIDREGDAKKRAEDKKREITIGSMVYTQMDEMEVRKVAQSLLIPGVDDMSESEARNTLYDKVLNDKDSYIEFTQTKAADNLLDIKSTIQKAIDKGLFSLDVKGRSKTWKLTKGSEKFDLIKVGVGRNQENVLIDYCKENPDLIEDVKKMLMNF